MTGFLSLFRRLEGPQTVGRGPAFWGLFAVVLAVALAYPLVSDGYTVGNTVYFFVWVFIALSLCLIWGYGGSLSFGQTAFFGIAGYGYGILTINFGSAYGFTLVALVVAVAIAALFAILLGYFMFFGRIAGVFLGIVYARRDVDAGAIHGPDRRAGVAYRQCATERLQRHERDAAFDHPLAG